MEAVNLAEKLATFSEQWQPRTVGQFNGHDLMVVKVKGEFVWHAHQDTDDHFFSSTRPEGSSGTDARAQDATRCAREPASGGAVQLR